MLDDDPVAEVEFHTASSQTESDGFFLCKLHLPIPVSCTYIYICHFRFSVTTETSFSSGELFT